MVGLCSGGYYLIRSYNVAYDLGLEALKKWLKQQSINVNIAAQNLWTDIKNKFIKDG